MLLRSLHCSRLDRGAGLAKAALRYTETLANCLSRRGIVMDHPESDIHEVARILLHGSREEQQKLISTLFTSDSSFSHPFVDCMGRDEIAAAYDYWAHTHKKIEFKFKDCKFNESKSWLVLFDFTALFWPHWWPWNRHAYGLHYDIEVDLRKHAGRYRVVRQDDTLRLLDSTRELPILGTVIGDESSLVRRGITKVIVTYWRIMNFKRPESVSQKHVS